MGSLAGGRGWGFSNTDELVVDPEEESVEESLDDSSLEDSPGSLFLFWVGGLGALLGCPLGGRWGLGLGSGVWGAGRGFGSRVARVVHTRAGGGGGGSAATCWQSGGAGERSPMLPHPSMRVARGLPRAAT